VVGRKGQTRNWLIIASPPAGGQVIGNAEVILRMGHKSETFPAAPLRAGPCKNFLASPSFTRLAKRILFLKRYHFTARRASMDFHSNLAMFTIVEAVIGELVKDGTIIKQ
jgi:hypothetical protein